MVVINSHGVILQPKRAQEKNIWRSGGEGVCQGLLSVYDHSHQRVGAPLQVFSRLRHEVVFRCRLMQVTTCVSSFAAR